MQSSIMCVYKGRENMYFHNDCASFDFYNDSFKGRIKDYVFTFENQETDIQQVINRTVAPLDRSPKQNDRVARIFRKFLFRSEQALL